MKVLYLLPLFAALLVAGCGEKSSPEGSESASEKPTAEPSADATQETEKPLTLPLSDADVERLLEAAVDLDSLNERDGLLYQVSKSEPFSGWAKEMYDSGQAKGLARFNDGKLEGPYTTWRENGQKKGEGAFEEGKAVSMKHWNSKGEEVETAEEAGK